MNQLVLHFWTTLLTQLVLTLEVLKIAKRFHITVSFLADTGLKEISDLVTKYNLLMKDFPLDELLAATDPRKIRSSLLLIFGHVNKKLKLSPYPVKRALPLMDSISRDLNLQLLKVLGEMKLMKLTYDAFEELAGACDEVFTTWDDQVKEFTSVAREVTRRRSEKFLPIKVHSAHAKLQERLVYIRNFRQRHQHFRSTISTVMAAKNGVMTADVDIVAEVDDAYSCVRGVDVIDVSGGGE